MSVLVSGVPLPAGALAFTVCQTPVVYTRGDTAQIEVTGASDRQETITGSQLAGATSRHIFARNGQIQLVQVMVEV